MDEYTPWEVYTNLLKMLEYRGVTLTSEQLDSDTLAQRLSHYYFISITGKRDQSDTKEHWVTVILLAQNSNFASKSGEFKRLLSKIKVVEGDTNNVIFVAHVDNEDEPLTKHIEKKLVIYRAEHPNVYVETLPHYIFQIEVPKHVLVPLHVIPSADEVSKFCALYRISKDMFPKILTNDSMTIWLGLRAGDVVKVYRISETAGLSIIYRLCE